MSNQTYELKVPSVGESVSEVEVGEWLKQEGDLARRDETVVVLETDKATVEVPAPAAGKVTRILKPRGARVKVGEVLGLLQPAEVPDQTPEVLKAAAPKKTAAAPEPPAPAKAVMPAAARLAAEQGVPLDRVTPSGPGGRVLKEDVQRTAEAVPAPPAATINPIPPIAPLPPSPAPAAPADRAEEIVPMTLLRRKIAERLVAAQKTAALLTTFNEVDMFNVMALRKEFQERFQERHKVKLGIMSFFVKAVTEALQQTPGLNAEIRDQQIIYHRYCDIGIAIGGGRGLVVPVLRNAEKMSFAEIELAIADYAAKARENKLRPEDLAGGTFTITNGGVYGSMLSTPLVNPPQSGVLGMHAIQERPVALNGQVVIRPIMYVALTYDHRIVDGREAVTFLKRVKELVENPVRGLIGI